MLKSFGCLMKNNKKKSNIKKNYVEIYGITKLFKLS